MSSWFNLKNLDSLLFVVRWIVQVSKPCSYHVLPFLPFFKNSSFPPLPQRETQREREREREREAALLVISRRTKLSKLGLQGQSSLRFSLNLVPYLSWNFLPLFASSNRDKFVGFGFAIYDQDEVVHLLGEKLKVFVNLVVCLLGEELKVKWIWSLVLFCGTQV